MISASYRDVGIFLLDDENGLEVDRIEGHRHDPVAICNKIIQKWLNKEGGKATWKALVEHLQSAQLRSLADDIEKGLQSESIFCHIFLMFLAVSCSKVTIA